jgi:putative membrane protein
MTKHLRSLVALALVSTVALFGCGEGTEDRTDEHTDSLSTTDNNGMNDTSRNNNADADFLSDAVEANTMEMRALMLGKEKGSKEVKSHAQHMIDDHKKLGDDVAAYIASKNLTLDDVDTADRDNDLNDKAAGKDFDKAWADKMVKDHEKVIDLFEDAQDDVNDAELKTMISNAIPKLKSHLDMAKQLQEKLDK